MSVETDGKLEGWLTDATNRSDRTVFPVATLIADPNAETAIGPNSDVQVGRCWRGGATVYLLATLGIDKLTYRGCAGVVEETL